jgi:hypothetical protein
MIMRWFLPLALGTGLLVTREVFHCRAEAAGAADRKSVWILAFLGWLPLLAWIANNLWPQN